MHGRRIRIILMRKGFGAGYNAPDDEGFVGSRCGIGKAVEIDLYGNGYPQNRAFENALL